MDSIGLELGGNLSEAENALIGLGFKQFTGRQDQLSIVSTDNKIDTFISTRKKVDSLSRRPDYHTALTSEQVSRATANGVKFVVAKLQWGKDDFGYSLHAEPTSYSTYGMQTTDFLAYLGFKSESCSFVARRVCYAIWVDMGFILSDFSAAFEKAFSLFEKGAHELEASGHFLDQPEGWRYFLPNGSSRAPHTKSTYGGDGHNAIRVENMKQSEDDDFFYRLSWLERAGSKGWVIHYKLKTQMITSCFLLLNY